MLPPNDEVIKAQKRYNLARNILLFAIVSFLALIYIAQRQALNNFSKQSDERKAGIVSIEKDIDGKIDKLQKEQECFATFFNQPNRQDLTLNTLDNQCSFTFTNPVQSSTPSSNPSSTGTSTSTQPTAQTNQTTTSAPPPSGSQQGSVLPNCKVDVLFLHLDC